jgi:hypothetical protein
MKCPACAKRYTFSDHGIVEITPDGGPDRD